MLCLMLILVQFQEARDNSQLNGDLSNIISDTTKLEGGK